MLAVWAVCVCAGAMPVLAATPLPSVPPGEPWWVRVAFAGRAVLQVRAEGDHIAADVAAVGQQASDDGGRTWHAIFERHGLVDPRTPGWTLSAGRAARRTSGGAYLPDPRSPSFGPTAPQFAGTARIAAPPNGYVVAVDAANQVWRRTSSGDWARALLLLPERIGARTPRITAVDAFDQPVSNAVYLATDGYAVLITYNGGDDWVRAGPGLPDDVDALYADSRSAAVYAGTRDGLWVHHVRAFPGPPVYPDAALHWRWVGIALVTLAAAALAVAGLQRVLRMDHITTIAPSRRQVGG